MKLDEWLNKNPEKAKGFHDRIGVAKMSLWRYRKGKHFPRDVIGKIVRETAGAVTANDFYNLAQHGGGRKRPQRPGGRDKSKKSKHHPLIGCLKGTIWIAPETDLTQPADPEWAEVAYGDRTWPDQE